MKKIEVSDDVKKSIVEYYSRGNFSKTNLVEIFNLSMHTITLVLHEFEIDTTKKSFVFSIEETQKIIDDYNKGIPCSHLADNYKTSKSIISKLLIRNNISIERYPSRTLSKLDKEDIIQRYNSGESSIEIAKIYNISYNIITKLLKRKGIEIRGYFPRYPVNETFFNEIDIEEKAYFLGMMTGDGCNMEDYNYVCLSLQEGDKEIVQKLNDLIQPEKPLTFKPARNPNHKNQYSFRIGSKQISQDLAKWGVMKDKTWKITWPEWLRDDLINHFLRGMLDSDGCIRPNGCVTIMSTRQACERMQQIVREKLDINSYSVIDKRQPNDNSRTFTVGGRNQMKKFLNWIYKDATIYMERKYQKYQELLAWKPKPLVRLFNEAGERLNKDELRIRANKLAKIARKRRIANKTIVPPPPSGSSSLPDVNH